jgi:hypothetical protein
MMATVQRCVFALINEGTLAADCWKALDTYQIGASGWKLTF